MSRRFSAFVSLACIALPALLLSPADAVAQAPRTIAFQGVLEDGGAPVTEATELTFRFFSAATGGTAQWTETQAVTPSGDGAFDVQFGAVTSLDAIAFDAPLWLDVEAGGSSLGPRTALAAAPYALGLYGVRVTPPSDPTYGPSVAAGLAANLATGQGAVVAGGGFANGTSEEGNVASGLFSVVSGGRGNTSSSGYATVSGGENNWASYTLATVGGGEDNTANGHSATVSGGSFNTAAAGTATVSGGTRNSASGYYSAIGGGQDNAAPGNGATIAGGDNNAADASRATVSGGENNSASGSSATVGGGNGNTASSSFATVGGGDRNLASNVNATVGGGSINTASNSFATVGGGDRNLASGNRATVPGGIRNQARGSYSLAAGYFAHAIHDGTFVWSDNSRHFADSLVSTGQDQFLVRATGGVGLNTNAPLAQLHVETLDINLPSAALLSEAFIVESEDAVAGLYSDTAGSWGSAIALGEIASGSLKNKWSIARRTGATGALHFTFGTDASYAANNTVMRIDTDGSVHADAAFTGGGADFAEYFPLDIGAAVKPGDLVGIIAGRAGLATHGSEQLMFVSSNPAFVGNPDAAGGGALVALVGQAEVRLSSPAQVGDLLVASGMEDGTARPVSPVHYDPASDGSVAGRVLQLTTEGTAMALVGVDEAAALRTVVARQQAQIDALFQRIGALERREPEVSVRR